MYPTRIRPFALATVGLMLAGVALNGGRVTADGAMKDHGPIGWTDLFSAARKTAAKEKKVIMIDFWATWCGPCKQMLATTYKDKEVVARAKQFVPVLVDVDKQEDLAKKYKVEAIPTVAFVNSDGKVLVQSVGYVAAKDFLKMMDEAKKKAKS